MRQWGRAGFAVLLLAAMRPAGAAAPDTGSKPAEPLPMPVRSGTVVVKVADYEAARQQMLAAAREQGAEVLHSRTQVNDKGKKHGWMRLRSPADRLPQLLTAAHGVGKLYAENVATSDEASEYEELERRVGRLREHQTRLSGVLQSPRRLRGSDLLYIQERLFRAGVDEGTLLQRRVDLQRAARASTLVVQLFEPGAEPVPEAPNLGKRFVGSLSLARQSFSHLAARWLTASAYLLVFAPLWAPCLAVAALVGRWLWRRGLITYWVAAFAARWSDRPFRRPPSSAGA